MLLSFSLVAVEQNNGPGRYGSFPSQSQLGVLEAIQGKSLAGSETSCHAGEGIKSHKPACD